MDLAITIRILVTQSYKVDIMPGVVVVALSGPDGTRVVHVNRFVEGILTFVWQSPVL
jgi:hypothetical protein